MLVSVTSDNQIFFPQGLPFSLSFISTDLETVQGNSNSSSTLSILFLLQLILPAQQTTFLPADFIKETSMSTLLSAKPVSPQSLLQCLSDFHIQLSKMFMAF